VTELGQKRKKNVDNVRLGYSNDISTPFDVITRHCSTFFNPILRLAQPRYHHLSENSRLSDKHTEKSYSDLSIPPAACRPQSVIG
jgi:hypothetical protein